MYLHAKGEEHTHMVPWVVGSIHMVDPLSYFSFQPVLHDWSGQVRVFNVHIQSKLL